MPLDQYPARLQDPTIGGSSGVPGLANPAKVPTGFGGGKGMSMDAPGMAADTFNKRMDAIWHPKPVDTAHQLRKFNEAQFSGGFHLKGPKYVGMKPPPPPPAPNYMQPGASAPPGVLPPQGPIYGGPGGPGGPVESEPMSGGPSQGATQGGYTLNPSPGTGIPIAPMSGGGGFPAQNPYVVSDRHAKQNVYDLGVRRGIEEALTVPPRTPLDAASAAIPPKSFEYRAGIPGLVSGVSQAGIMAQDAERNPMTAAMVRQTPEGKAIDIPAATSFNLARGSEQSQRIQDLENKIYADSVPPGFKGTVVHPGSYTPAPQKIYSDITNVSKLPPDFRGTVIHPGTFTRVVKADETPTEEEVAAAKKFEQEYLNRFRKTQKKP